MNVRLQSSYKKIVVYILTLSLSVYFGWMIFQPWLIDGHIHNLLSGEDFQKNTPIKSQDSNYYYLLGRYYQYSPLLRDLKKAKDFYIEAIHLNPVKAEYWIDLAKIENALDNPIYADRAINRALSLKPAGLNVHWETANFRLKMGEVNKALSSFKYIAYNYPTERRKVYPLLWLATKGDLNVIMKEAIPEDIESRVDYLWYLIGREQKREAKKVWYSIVSNNLHPPVRLRYINNLIAWGDIEDAIKEWKYLKRIDNVQKNLVWNASFEENETLNNGFDWRIGKVRGSEITIDNGKAKEGKHSLKIEFNGEENVNFYHLSQVVPLEPERRYVLSTSVRSSEITTTNGIKIDFSGLYGCKFYKATEMITGTNPWKELTLEIETPENCKAGRVRVRREESSKFNNRISGTVWIDDVRVEEVPSG
jgi:tetratricopeptide (TPR) repeat protein